jgi:hypothetical protein
VSDEGETLGELRAILKRAVEDIAEAKAAAVVAAQNTADNKLLLTNHIAQLTGGWKVLVWLVSAAVAAGGLVTALIEWMHRK